MAAHWRPAMTTLQEQWAGSNKFWWSSFTSNRFVFCFANRWATQKELIYYIRNGLPTTEQFFSGRAAPTIPGFDVRHATFPRGPVFGTPQRFVIDGEGKIYSSDSRTPSTQTTQYNYLGTGPLSVDGTWNPQVDPLNSRAYCLTLRPAIGADESFQDVRFLETAFCGQTCVALSETGHLWYTGRASADLMLDSDLLTSSNGNLSYFTEFKATEFYDSSGTFRVPEQPLTFQHIWAQDGRRNPPCLLALSTDGRLFIKGTFLLGNLKSSPRFHEVGGFVDSVTVTNGGSGFPSNAGVSVSAPNSEYGGVTAQVRAVVSGGVVTRIDILNAGWGYSSPPTITMTEVGGGSGATIQATLFSDAWKNANISSRSNTAPTIAAVSASGLLYAWGDGILNPLPSTNITSVSSAASPQKMRNQPALVEFKSVALISDDGTLNSAGAALTTSGTLFTWGFDNNFAQNRFTPTTFNQFDLTQYDQSVVFTKIQGGYRMMCLLRDNGQVMTYGNNFNSGRLITNPSAAGNLPIGPIDGDAVWKDIFLTYDNIVLARVEQLDELGNRVNPLPPISGFWTAH